MRAALTVARELLRCRLMESSRDALMERVAEPLDAAASGTPPLCSFLTPQVVAGPHDGPRRARAPPGAPAGFVGTGAPSGAGHPTTHVPPPMGVGVSICNAPDTTFHICNSDSCLFRRGVVRFPSWLGFVFVLLLSMSCISYHVIMCIAFPYMVSHASEHFPRCPFCNLTLLCPPAPPFASFRERVLNIL